MKKISSMKKALLPFLLVLCLLASCSCDDSGSTTNTSGDSQTETPVEENGTTENEATSEEDSAATEGVMTDRAGNEFALPETMNRIMSTAPSNTEILIA